MNKNKEVIEHCPHFYTIINFEYYSDDIISEKLIDIYEKYIFSVDINENENIRKIEKLDRVLYKYINDSYFRELIKVDMSNAKAVKGDNLLDIIVNTILSVFDKYDKIMSRKAQTTRWI